MVRTVKKTMRVLWETMKWIFIVFCVFLGSLFFREQPVPGEWIAHAVELRAPTNLVIEVGSAAIGFRRGLHLEGFGLYDREMADPTRVLVGADTFDFNPFSRRIRIEGLKYTRLPDSYYAPGNLEKNARVECEFPDLGAFRVELLRPDILSVRPERVETEVEVAPHRIDFRRIRLDWPDADARMSLDGFCTVDLDRQEVRGEVDGLARQAHIRPLLVTLDVPVSLPYMDAFTEVPEPCRAKCTWAVDLVRNDLDLGLDLHPILGKYNGVSMKKADGQIRVRNWTRGTCLNYLTTVGPIAAVDVNGRTLDGTVTVTGTNNYTVVDVDAKSALPLANVLKIGGFTGEYVGEEVIGDSDCRLQFRFPRAMTNNYEVLNGFGHVTVKNGQLMRMKGFRGLIAAMPSVAPAITWFTDSTQASCDYVIENGVLKTDNIYIEGTLFSIKMYGSFDAVRERMDFTVRVQFAKSGSMIGKLLHPLTWPFTKLLLEFRLTGSPEKPEWKYVSVIDRVVEAVK